MLRQVPDAGPSFLYMATGALWCEVFLVDRDWCTVVLSISSETGTLWLEVFLVETGAIFFKVLFIR